MFLRGRWDEGYGFQFSPRNTFVCVNMCLLVTGLDVSVYLSIFVYVFKQVYPIFQLSSHYNTSFEMLTLRLADRV